MYRLEYVTTEKWGEEWQWLRYHLNAVANTLEELAYWWVKFRKENPDTDEVEHKLLDIVMIENISNEDKLFFEQYTGSKIPDGNWKPNIPEEDRLPGIGKET